MKITWLGTASVRIETEGERILFDPFVQLAGGENPNCIDDFWQDRTVFITHGHLDHLMEAPELLDAETGSDATVFCESGSGYAGQDFGGHRQCGCGKAGGCDPSGSVSVRVWEGRSMPDPERRQS